MLLGEQCRLCLQFVPKLRNSHIIPEFFYKLIYDAKHQFNVFSDTDSPPGRLEQKGLREYLLCGDCEQKLGRWEKYVKELLFDEAPQGIDRGDRMEYLGVDYAQFKLFQMSLIWRMGASALEPFSNVDLGNTHEERLRDMLNRSDPGEPYEYGCWIVHVAYQIREVGSVIVPPTKAPKKVLGHTCYRAVLGGLFWGFYISSHMAQFPQQQLFLSRSHVLPVWKETPAARQFVREMIEPVADKHAPVT